MPFPDEFDEAVFAEVLEEQEATHRVVFSVLNVLIVIVGIGALYAVLWQHSLELLGVAAAGTAVWLSAALFFFVRARREMSRRIAVKRSLGI